ncbi:MAG: hypothetical protein PHQ40_17245 [Anaerolineaceae bacterium]|nr:hypothetical protein [Anaerolineaceae bacterium]
MARIVETDNFGGDYPGERFVLFAMPKEHAERIADAINDAASPNSPRYWKVVDNDYELQP